jgi:ABC transporter DrrB family efflux protein
VIRLRYLFSDTVVLAQRSLKRIPRNPDLLTAFTVQPVMFVLLFRYVFGGAISVPAEFGSYADFLIPGIIVQSMAFGGFVTALGLAEDMQRGIIARFRALPTSRPAVLTGRTPADIATNMLALAVMIGVGLAVGFSFSTSPFEVVAGILLMLLIGYAFSWVFAWIGLIVSSPETANAFGFIAIFPLTFISSAFVPPESMPEPLDTFAADINPFSKMVDAARALFLGTPAGDSIWVSVLWCLGLIAAFGALAVNRYRRSVAAA